MGKIVEKLSDQGIHCFGYHNSDTILFKFQDFVMSEYLTFSGLTITTLSFRTYRSGQTVQPQIRMLLEEQSDPLLEEQSDQGLNCLLFNLHLFDNIASLFEFYSKIFWCPKI